VWLSSQRLLPTFHLDLIRLVLLVFFFSVGVVDGFTTFPFASSQACTPKCDEHFGSGTIVENGNDALFMVGDDSTDAMRDVVGCIHHTALKTRNITLAIQFYSLLGFEPTAKFKAGPARAAWLEQQQLDPAADSKTTLPKSRIELIEVPSWILKEPEGMKRRALDLFEHQDYLGQNHLALDVTKSICDSEISASPSPANQTFLLSAWMETLNEKSLRLFRKTLRVALEAEQFMVGNIVYERGFIYDADGALIELLNKAAELPQQIDPMAGWERYEWFKEMNVGDSEQDDSQRQQ